MSDEDVPRRSGRFRRVSTRLQFGDVEVRDVPPCLLPEARELAADAPGVSSCKNILLTSNKPADHQTQVSLASQATFPQLNVSKEQEDRETHKSPSLTTVTAFGILSRSTGRFRKQAVPVHKHRGREFGESVFSAGKMEGEVPARRKRGRPRKNLEVIRREPIGKEVAIDGQPFTKLTVTFDRARDSATPPTPFVVRPLRKRTQAEIDAHYRWVTENIRNSKPAAFPSLAIGAVRPSSPETTKGIVNEMRNDPQVAPIGEDDKCLHTNYPVDQELDQSRLEVLLGQYGLSFWASPDMPVEETSVKDGQDELDDLHAPLFMIPQKESDLLPIEQIKHNLTDEHANVPSSVIYPDTFLCSRGLPRFADLEIRIQVELVKTMMRLGGWAPINWRFGLKVRWSDMQAIANQMKEEEIRESLKKSIPGMVEKGLRVAGQTKEYEELWDHYMAQIAADDKKVGAIGKPGSTFSEDHMYIPMNERKKASRFLRCWRLSQDYLGPITPGEGDGIDGAPFRGIFLKFWNMKIGLPALTAGDAKPGATKAAAIDLTSEGDPVLAFSPSSTLILPVSHIYRPQPSSWTNERITSPVPTLNLPETTNRAELCSYVIDPSQAHLDLATSLMQPRRQQTAPVAPMGNWAVPPPSHKKPHSYDGLGDLIGWRSIESSKRG